MPIADVRLLGAPTRLAAARRTLAICMLLVCAIYLYLASGPVYGARGAPRALQTFVLSLAAMVNFLGYRFVLLLITLQTT